MAIDLRYLDVIGRHEPVDDGDYCYCRRCGGEQCDCPDSPRYRALGNAVAVPVAEWVLRRLAVLESEQQCEAVA